LFKAIFIKKIKENEKSAFDLLAKCHDGLDRKLLLIIEFPVSGSRAEVEKYLNSKIRSRHKRLQILSGYLQKKRVEEEQRLVIHLIDQILKDTEKLKDVNIQQQYLKKIANVKSLFWNKLLSLYLATFSNNKFWAEKIVDEILLMGPYVSLIEGIENEKINTQKIVNFITKIMMVFEREKYHRNYKYLISRISNYSGNKMHYKQLENRFGATWSLNELRELYLNPWIRFRHFDFLFEKMMTRSSEAEVKVYMRKIMKDPILVNSCGIKQLWFLRDFYPRNKEIRRLIINRLSKSWIEGDTIEKYQLLKMMRSPLIKKALKKRHYDLKRPIFKIQRDFFMELLSSGKATDFSFYKLYNLGDHDHKHLWWMIY
jgi:hypothetical protein